MRGVPNCCKRVSRSTAPHCSFSSSNAKNKSQSDVVDVTSPLLDKLAELGIIGRDGPPSKRQPTYQHASNDEHTSLPKNNSLFNHRDSALDYVNQGRKHQMSWKYPHHVSKSDDSTPHLLRDEEWITDTEQMSGLANTLSSVDVAHAEEEEEDDAQNLQDPSAIVRSLLDTPNETQGTIQDTTSADLLPLRPVHGYSVNETHNLDHLVHTVENQTAPNEALSQVRVPNIRRPHSEIAFLFRMKHPQAEEIYRVSFNAPDISLSTNHEIQWNRFLFHSQSQKDGRLYAWSILKWLSYLKEDNPHSLKAFRVVLPHLPNSVYTQLWRLVLSGNYWIANWMRTANSVSLLASFTDTVNYCAANSQRSIIDPLRTIEMCLNDQNIEMVLRDDEEDWLLQPITETELIYLLSKEIRHDHLHAALEYVSQLQSVQLSYSFHQRLLNSIPLRFSLSLFESYYQFNQATFTMYRDVIAMTYRSGNESLAWKYYNDLQNEPFSWKRIRGLDEIVWDLQHKFLGLTLSEVLTPYMHGNQIHMERTKMMLMFLRNKIQSGDEEASHVLLDLDLLIERDIRSLAPEIMSLRTESILLIDPERALQLFEDDRLWSIRPYRLYVSLIERFVDNCEVASRLYNMMHRSGRRRRVIPMQYLKSTTKQLIISMIFDGRPSEAFDMMKLHYNASQFGIGSIKMTEDVLSMFIEALLVGPANAEMIVGLLSSEIELMHKKKHASNASVESREATVL